MKKHLAMVEILEADPGMTLTNGVVACQRVYLELTDSEEQWKEVPAPIRIPYDNTDEA